MDQAAFIPAIYLKPGCPFCLKLRLFLLEAGLLDRVKLVEAATLEEHQALADELTAKIGKTTFPTAEIEPGEYLADSDALIAPFADDGIDLNTLPAYQSYVTGVLPRLQQLFRENLDFKKRLE